VARAVAFERLLESGDKLRARLVGAFDSARDEPQLVHIATDGETYGHHHRFGDMALAYALRTIDEDPSLRLTNYGQYLAAHPPTHEVRIIEDTSWSCAHGIERWRSDCGCNSGGHPSWNQAWRTPLRAAFDGLRSDLEAIFVREMAALVPEAWRARDAYVDVILDRSPESLQRFFGRYARPGLDETQHSRLLKLLEMQRHALLMYTSCAWFFDELSGIETVQCIRYAGRAIQIATQLGHPEVEAPFVERLRLGMCNVPERGDGAQVYADFVGPDIVDLPRLVAHWAVSSLFSDYEEHARVFAFEVDQLDVHVRSLGRSKLAVGRVRVTSEITLEARTLSFGVLHLGDHNLSGGVREFQGTEEFARMSSEVLGAFVRADMPEVLRLLDKHFLELTYSLRSLFRDEQRRVLDIIVGTAMTDAEGLGRRVYEAHSPLLRYLATLEFAMPSPLRRLADFVLNTTLRAELGRRELDFSRIRTLLEEAEAVGTPLDRIGMGFALQQTIEEGLLALASDPEPAARLRRLRKTAELAATLPLDLELALAQNRFYSLSQTIYPPIREQARRGDPKADAWCTEFRALGAALRMRTT
jgi:hypothetical protein